MVSFTSCSFVNNSVVAADRYLSKIVAGGGAYASIDGHSGVILFLNCTVSVNSALLVRAYRQGAPVVFFVVPVVAFMICNFALHAVTSSAFSVRRRSLC